MIFFCFCRLCTRARRRAGRSTAQHRTQMGSASAPWSHQPRTCVTATHAAGSSASSWRRWQLSITHFETRLLPTQAQAQKHKLPQSTILVSDTVCRTQAQTFYFLYPTVGQQLKQWEDCWLADELAFSLLTWSVGLFTWTKILQAPAEIVTLQISLNAARKISKFYFLNKNSSTDAFKSWSVGHTLLSGLCSSCFSPSEMTVSKVCQVWEANLLPYTCKGQTPKL